MVAAAEATPVAVTAYAMGETLVKPGVIGSEEYDLLRAEHDEYARFLLLDKPEAIVARHVRLRQCIGTVKFLKQSASLSLKCLCALYMRAGYLYVLLL